jgi:hypothetical protein
MENQVNNKQSDMEIKDLCFIEQVLVWGIRMKVRGKQYFEKVEAHFEKNLSPAAGRIALNSINIIINSVRNHGIRSLTLNCTCMTKLSSDEELLITLFRGMDGHDLQPNAQPAQIFVSDEGQEYLIHAILSFKMAMETIDSCTPDKLSEDAISHQRNASIHGQASKLIH